MFVVKLIIAIICFLGFSVCNILALCGLLWGDDAASPMCFGVFIGEVIAIILLGAGILLLI